MELADYLRVLRRRWWLIGLAVVVCAAGALAASFTQTPRYTSSTQLLVGGTPNESGTDELVARQLAAQRAGAYSLLLPAPPAVAEVSERMGVVGGNAAVAATADGTSAYINVTVTADSPQAAQKIAVGYGRFTAEVVAKLEQRPATSLVSITTTIPPGLPSSPVSPDPQRNFLIGAVIGLLLGLAGALAREALDARLRDSSEIEKLTGVTLLGSIPKEYASDVLPAMTRPRSGRAEAYRHVRTNLEFTSADGMPRSVVVTSPAPGEGKSTTAANLAIVAARSGRSVVLVDADLRKPTVARNFGLQASIGLSDVLTGRWRWQEALVPVEGENLHILASGSIPRFPSELVGSSRMAELIQELEASFDFVIVDSPPVLPVSDALVIGVNVDGVIVVARMVETRRAALKRAVDAIGKVNATLLGVVGNAVVKQEEKAYGEGYGYAYGYTSNASEEPSAPPTVVPAERRGPETRRRGRHAGVDPTQQPQEPARGLLDAEAGLWPPTGQPQQPAQGQPYAPNPYAPNGYPPNLHAQNGYAPNGYPSHGYATNGQPPAPYVPDPYAAPNQHPPHAPRQFPSTPQAYGQAPAPQVPGHHGQPLPPQEYDLEAPFQEPGRRSQAWSDQPWGMPPQGSGPMSPADAMKLDDIIRQRPQQD